MAEVREGAMLKNRYVLRRRLGHGGMAAVWLGQDLTLDRAVAVKVLSDAIGSDRTYATRFRREATVAAGLSHPNLVRIYDYSESDERPFLVMEFVPGEDLGRRIDRGAPIDRDRLARELLGAVAHIHGHGIIHRDIKPHNVIVADDASAKLIDFGIALPPDATALTQPGLVIATKRYAAPEVLAGEPADARSDLYSCGVLLDACAGPASPDLRRLISRLTNQQPGDRPPSAVAALGELEQVPAAPSRVTEPFRPPFAESPTREEAPAPGREPATLPTGVYGRGRSNRRRWLAAAAILAVAVAVGIAVASSGGGGSPKQAQGGHGPPSGPQAKASKRGPRADEQSQGSEEEAPAEVVRAPSGATAGEADPATGIALNEQGFALIQAGEYDAAVPILEESVASFPAGSEELDYAYALFNLGDALLRSGRPADAIPVLEQRLQIPDQTEVVERELAAARQEAEAAGN